MKLYFKQRMFSWFDSYDIYYMNGGEETGAVAYTVEGMGPLPPHSGSPRPPYRHREAADIYLSAEV